MATSEEIQAAYDLVYNNEKDIAIEYLALVEKFEADLAALAAKIPSQGSNSSVSGAISQTRSTISMYSGTTSSLKSIYGLNPPLVTPVVNSPV